MISMVDTMVTAKSRPVAICGIIEWFELLTHRKSHLPCRQPRLQRRRIFHGGTWRRVDRGGVKVPSDTFNGDFNGDLMVIYRGDLMVIYRGDLMVIYRGDL